ncbi:UNVERIFIED_CONTAM: hypothetical protein GTU68_013555 [Idotea baltica]|nr:hypothetical protein [Idotea baltica]
MSINSFGHLFRVTTWGESHGPAIGATVDGCPPGVVVDEAMIQHWLDRRKPGQNKYTTQRREPDQVRILSGVFEGQTTGTPVQLMIENTDQRSKDYGDIKDKFRPGHADITYWQKYGIRDYRGGGRSSARETASRVAAGGWRARRSGRWRRMFRSQAIWCRWGNTPSTGLNSTGRRSKRTHSGHPMRKRRKPGPPTSMGCANPAARSGRSSKSLPAVCPQGWAHRSMASSIRIWPPQ